MPRSLDGFHWDQVAVTVQAWRLGPSKFGVPITAPRWDAGVEAVTHDSGAQGLAVAQGRRGRHGHRFGVTIAARRGLLSGLPSSLLMTGSRRC